MENLKITEKSWVEVIKTPRLYYVRVYDPETDRYITRMTGKTCKVEGNFIISFQRAEGAADQQVKVLSVLFVDPADGHIQLFENVSSEIVTRFNESGLCFCRLYEKDWYYWCGNDQPLTYLGRFNSSLAFLVFVGRENDEDFLMLMSDEAFEKIPYLCWEKFYDEKQNLETVRILKPNGEKVFVRVKRSGSKLQAVLEKYEGSISNS